MQSSRLLKNLLPLQNEVCMAAIGKITAPESAKAGESVNIMVRAAVPVGGEGCYLAFTGLVPLAAIYSKPSSQWCDAVSGVDFSMTPFFMPPEDARVELTLWRYAMEGWVIEDQAVVTIKLHTPQTPVPIEEPHKVGGLNIGLAAAFGGAAAFILYSLARSK